MTNVALKRVNMILFKGKYAYKATFEQVGIKHEILIAQQNMIACKSYYYLHPKVYIQMKL